MLGVRIVAALCVLLGTLADAHAQGIVLESYSQARPASATQLLAPLHEELAARGYSLADTFGRKYEARISRPVTTADGLTPDFEAGVERGHKAWIAGKFDNAVEILAPLIEAAHANPGAISHNQPQRNKLLKGLVALALSQQRKGDIAAAKDVIGEILRSFPEAQVSRASYGPDAYRLFEEVRRTIAQSGRGRLAIEVPSDQSVVFLNERFENVGKVSKGDLIPGDYRVYVQVGKVTSRLHQVTVRADEEAKLTIDARFDQVLTTSSAWAGFVFANTDEREKLETRYASLVATQLGAAAVVVVGIDQVRGRPALVGSVVDLRTAREIRRASVAIEPAPGVERLRALARFLAGDQAASGLDVEIGAAQAAVAEPVETPSAPSGRRWMKWTGVTAIGLGLVGGGVAYKYFRDGNAAGDEIDRVCAVSCTSEQVRVLQGDEDRANRRALIAGVAGGALVVTGVVFLIASRSSDAPASSVAVVPSRDGVSLTYAASF